MKKTLLAMATALIVAGLATTAVANHHEKGEKPAAECTHAADEPCPHKAHEAGKDAAQCDKHAKGEACTCAHAEHEGHEGHHGADEPRS